MTDESIYEQVHQEMHDHYHNTASHEEREKYKAEFSKIEQAKGYRARSWYGDFWITKETEIAVSLMTPSKKKFYQLKQYCRDRRYAIIGGRSAIDCANGTVGKHLRMVWNSHYVPVNGHHKYYPIPERKARLKKYRKQLVDVVIDRMEKYEYKLTFTASEVGDLIGDVVREAYKVETYEDSLAQNKANMEKYEELFNECTKEIDNATADALCGVEKNVVLKLKEIEAKYLAVT